MPLEVQARRIRASRLKREADYRLRDTAAGVWPRLVALLARTENAWAVNPEVIASLEERGYGPHPIGLELSPRRTMVVVPAEEFARLPAAKELPVRVADVLAEELVVLVPFPAS